MRIFRANLGLLGLLLLVGGALVAASGQTPSASAAGPFGFTGVTCLEVTQSFPRASLILARIEPSGPSTWDVMSVGYEGDTNGDTIADTNAGPPCNELDDNNSLTAAVQPEPQGGGHPS